MRFAAALAANAQRGDCEIEQDDVANKRVAKVHSEFPPQQATRNRRGAAFVTVARIFDALEAPDVEPQWLRHAVERNEALCRGDLPVTVLEVRRAELQYRVASDIEDIFAADEVVTQLPPGVNGRKIDGDVDAAAARSRRVEQDRSGDAMELASWRSTRTGSARIGPACVPERYGSSARSRSRRRTLHR